FALTGLVAEKD
ncbi:hypothetical protein MK372_08615, partial [Streptococcus oralis]|nr:hypothetical protein [Streptococcus oralis]